MTQASTIDWNAFFRIWAVVGPLLAAGASALWARRNQVQDRNYETSRDSVRFERDIQSKEAEHEMQLRTESYKEIKGALANFMASTNDYVTKAGINLTTPTVENAQASVAAQEKWNYNCQLVMLLGDQELSDLAVHVWNIGLSVPRSYKLPADDEHTKKLIEY
jgi:hypothetical protein